MFQLSNKWWTPAIPVLCVSHRDRNWNTGRCHCEFFSREGWWMSTHSPPPVVPKQNEMLWPRCTTVWTWRVDKQAMAVWFDAAELILFSTRKCGLISHCNCYGFWNSWYRCSEIDPHLLRKPCRKAWAQSSSSDWSPSSAIKNAPLVKQRRSEAPDLGEDSARRSNSICLESRKDDPIFQQSLQAHRQQYP